MVTWEFILLLYENVLKFVELKTILPGPNIYFLLLSDVTL